MTLSRDEIGTGLLDELQRFQRLVASLDAGDLARPSRCEGWTVGDVAAHMTGTVVDIVEGRLDGLGSPEVTEREVVERRGRSGSELADELAGAIKGAKDLLALFDDAAWEAPAPGGFDGTLRQGIEAIYYDAYLHGDDILSALGRPSVGGNGVRAAVHHVAAELEKRNWGPATLAFDGIEEVAVGSGGGEHRTGDALRFVLAATGRAPATDVLNIYAD
ncbi:MAG: maleylpyruvate isomerase family mycothiol-dependent enzyme [Actinobacteria bacterium]|nr:maleylpyruvate isomerase family mycothiol-dependent enzyme [Actinomycetota bacterium]